MHLALNRITCLFSAAICLGLAQVGRAGTQDLGNGFRHHGVAVPISGHRGLVATVDGANHRVVLAWLNDHRGGYELLLIDVDTGKTQEYPLPFPPGDHPFASLLSSRNKFYTHFNSHFVEFDPVQRAFTFSRKTAPQMAMSMTEDDEGLIWSATYPQSGVASFDPQTRTFRDYGQVYKQDWAQYPRSIAVDDAGFVYFGVGSTKGQIVALDRQTGQATPLVPESERGHGYGEVYRDEDGKVYGQPIGGKSDNWHMLYRGNSTRIGTRTAARPKRLIAGSQGLFHSTFPDGSRIRSFDLTERVLVVENPKSGETKMVRFDYQSEGAHIMGLAAAPNGTICGGVSFPMRFFSYDPRADAWQNRDGFCQWNTVAASNDRFFVGGYGGGLVLQWDPAKPWIATEAGKADSNPRLLARSAPTINRPHDLLVHPDGKTLILAGTPGYGLTGGGLLFWDKERQQSELVTHERIIEGHSTMSLVALPDAKLLGGTTISAGTGGKATATVAELYIMDLLTKRVEWHEAVFPGAREFTDLCVGPAGLVYGFADRARFFVFDSLRRKVIHERPVREEFGPTASQQGPQVFVSGPGGKIYVLFVAGIAEVEPRTFRIQMLAKSPVPIQAGGDFLDGRIYFINGSHVYSYQIPAAKPD